MGLQNEKNVGLNLNGSPSRDCYQPMLFPGARRQTAASSQR